MDKKINKNFKRNLIWNLLGTGLNSFNSLFFLIIVTRINGIDEAGVFTLAFSTACILYIVGIYTGRVYQVSENNKEISDKDYIVNRIISFFIMMILVIIFTLVKNYDIKKSIIFILLALFKGIEAISDVFYGIMQKNDILYRAGQSYFLKSLFGIIGFFIVDYYTHNIIMTIIILLIIWLIFMVIVDLPIIYKFLKKSKKIKIKNVLKIFRSGFFVFIISFLGLYILNASKYAIDNFLKEDIQAIFGIIIMPATVINLFGQFLLHPYLNRFIEYKNNNNYSKLKKESNKIMMYIFVFGILSSIIAYFLGAIVLGFIYNINLEGYSLYLAIILLAATLYNIGFIYSNILITLRNIGVQVVIYLMLSIIVYFMANILTKINGINGAIYAYLIIMAIYFMIYIIVGRAILKIMEKKYENINYNDHV